MPKSTKSPPGMRSTTTPPKPVPIGIASDIINALAADPEIVAEFERLAEWAGTRVPLSLAIRAVFDCWRNAATGGDRVYHLVTAAGMAHEAFGGDRSSDSQVCFDLPWDEALPTEVPLG